MLIYHKINDFLKKEFILVGLIRNALIFIKGCKMQFYALNSTKNVTIVIKEPPSINIIQYR